MAATSIRMERTQESMAHVMALFNSRLNIQRVEDPLACDFMFGNPHEMPLPGFVSALQQWIIPQNKDWFAYKMNEERPRQVLAENLRSTRGLEFRPEDIFMTTGAFAGLAVVLNAVIEPGDEIIFVSPPWFFYETLILAAGGIPVRVKINPATFDLDINIIAAAISAKTRAIIINSPNNPTGKIYPESTLKELARLLNAASFSHSRAIYLLSDEAYSRIVYDGSAYPSPTAHYPNSFLIYTYGKTLLTPGQRLGYIALPPRMPEGEMVRQAIFTAQLTSGFAIPNALMQYALPDLEKLSIDIEHLQLKRDRMVSELRRMGYHLHLPEGTFYLMPRSPIADDYRFTSILSEEHIYCLPGAVCEMPGYFRISLTANDEMIARALPGFARAWKRCR
jgi:aspartate aminotransferase